MHIKDINFKLGKNDSFPYCSWNVDIEFRIINYWKIHDFNKASLYHVKRRERFSLFFITKFEI